MPSIGQDNAKSAPLAYTVKGAAYAIGVSRSKLYMMMKAGTLRSVKVAGCRRIPAEALRDLLKQGEGRCAA